MTVREVPLTRGMVALVDASDYERVMASGPWHAQPSRHTFYAARGTRRADGRLTTEKLHRFVIDAPPGAQVDHADGDGLNNTRANLRLATNAENARNRRARADNRAGYKGVSLHPRTLRWQARIRVDGRSVSLGYFPTAEDAAEAYAVAARKHFGEFARTGA